MRSSLMAKLYLDKLFFIISALQTELPLKTRFIFQLYYFNSWENSEE